MKMVEVITGLRALTPDLRAQVDELLSRVQEAHNLAADAKNCSTRDGLRALVLPLSAALSQLAYTAMSVDAASTRLEALVNGYTRQFKEEAGAPVEDPRQPDLPGIDVRIEPTPVATTEPVVELAALPHNERHDDAVPVVVKDIADAAAKAVTNIVRAAEDDEDPED